MKLSNIGATSVVVAAIGIAFTVSPRHSSRNQDR